MGRVHQFVSYSSVGLFCLHFAGYSKDCLVSVSSDQLPACVNKQLCFSFCKVSFLTVCVDLVNTGTLFGALFSVVLHW